MKKILLSIIVLLSLAQFAHCQGVENSLFKLDFLLPGITFEQKVTSQSTVVINPLWALGYTNYGDESYFSINLNINLEYRYYCNFKRRERLGKNTLNNSANYFGPRAIVALPEMYENDYYQRNTDVAVGIGAVYGIQRTYRSGIYLMSEFGYGFVVEGGDPFLILAFKLGYVFKHNKKYY